MKNKKKHLILIVGIAAFMVILLYFVSLIPKNSSLPKPSKLSCSVATDCPKNETCRREISLVTNNFFGKYNCLHRVWDGGKCETWNNCLSGTCSQGVCRK